MGNHEGISNIQDKVKIVVESLLQKPKPQDKSQEVVNKTTQRPPISEASRREIEENFHDF